MPWPATSLSTRLKVRHMHFVLVLSETRSMTQAANKLAVSYPAAIKTRQEIESLIGGRLTSGRGDASRLSEIGERLAQACRIILDELNCTGEEINALREGLRGHVTIGVRLVDGLRWLAPAIVAFRERHPGVTLSLVDGLHEHVANGEVDLALARLGLIKRDQSLAFAPVLPVRTVIMHSLKTNWPADEPEPELASLLDGPWCLPPQGTPLRDRFDSHVLHADLRPPANVIVISDNTAQAEMFRAGEFYGISSARIAAELVSGGIARIVISQFPQLDDHLALIWRPDARLHPAVERFKTFLLEWADREKPGGLAPAAF